VFLTFLRQSAVAFAVLVTAGAVVGLAAPGSSSGASSAGAVHGPGVPAGLTALLAHPSRWSATVSVETAAGYKDNLLLNAAADERSAFARVGVETMWLRPPGGRLEQSFFLQAEGTRFASGRSVDHEARAWMQADLGWRVGETLKVSAPVTGYHYDQVFDLSDTDVERVIAEMKLTGLMAGPLVRWEFLPAWWLEAQGTVDRKRYDDDIYDARTGEGAARLGWKPGERLELRATGTRRWRDFDSRVQYSAAGRPLSDTRLAVEETDAELRAAVKWGRDLAWQATTRAGRLNYRDNGSGYFNYRERRVEQECEWRDEVWQVRVSGTARRVEFEVRTVGISATPTARLKDEYELAVAVERRLGGRWTLLGRYQWERIRSNDPVSSYRVNEGLLGVRWTWER
jgi:hypothetical protein